MFTGGGAARSLAKFKMQHSVQRGGEVRSLVKFKMQHSDQRGWRDFDLL